MLNSRLAELDGVSKNNDEFLMIIGSSNRPMDLDDAVVRRFDSRIHVPLPDINSASKIVRIHTVEEGVEFTGESSEYAPHSQDVARSIPRTIGQACVRRGFSGSDIESLCRTAVSMMVHEQNPDLGEYARNGFDGLKKWMSAYDRSSRLTFSRPSGQSLRQSPSRAFVKSSNGQQSTGPGDCEKTTQSCHFRPDSGRIGEVAPQK